jgi:chromosome segregation ATPase
MDLATISTIVGLCSPVVAFFAVIFAAGRKAEQYKNLVDNVKKNDKAIEGIHEILLSLQGVSGKASSFQKNLEITTKSVTDTSAAVADLRLKISLLENMIQNQIKQWESLEKNVTGMLKDASGNEVKLEHLKEAIDRNTSILENLRERVSAIEARCQSTHRG